MGFHEIDERKVGLFIADVAGHGVPASLVSSMLNVIFSFTEFVAMESSKLMGQFNEILCKDSHDRFVTASYSYIDLENKKLVTSNAGHWPVLIYRDGEIIQLKPRGLWMGIKEDVDYKTEEIDLQNGDRIIMFTDGIIEERSLSGEMFGEERFFDLIQKNRNLSTQEFIDLLFDTIIDFTAKSESEREMFEDDMTFIVADID